MTVELVKLPFWYLFKPRRLVGGWIKVEGGDEGGRYCPKYLKRGGTEKRGMGHKNLKTGGGASWTKGWMPLKGGLEPLYELCLKHSLKSYFSSVLLRKWIILNVPFRIKNIGYIANIWTFRKQQLLVFKQTVFLTMYSSFLILFIFSTPNTLFFSHICICAFILESHYFRKFIAASKLKRSHVLKS